MAVLVRCPCGQTTRVPDEHRGKQAACPKCGRTVAIEGERVPDRDVFISYSSLDKATADAACAELESRGVRCWIAPRDILPGTEWSEAIVAGLEQCRITVLVFSNHSNLSPQVRRELERAVHLGHPIIPFRIQNVPPCRAMQYYIASQHWLDAMTPPLQKHLRDLADIVVRLMSGTKDAEVLVQKYLIRKRERFWPAALAAALVLAIVLAAGFATVGLLKHGERGQAVAAQARAAESRQQAIQRDPGITGTLAWSEAQKAEGEAASAFELRDYSTAHARWIAAANRYDEALSVLPRLSSLEAARTAYNRELSAYDRSQLEQEGGKAWQDSLALVAGAEQLGKEGRFQEAAAKYEQARRSIPSLTAVGRALQTPTQWEFIDTPLVDFVDFIKELHELQIEMNWAALSEIGVLPDSPVTSKLSGVTLDEALRLMLAQINRDMRYTVRKGRYVYISTKKDIAAMAADDPR